MNCVLCTIHRALYTVHCELYSVHFMLCIVHCTLCTMHVYCILCTVNYAQFGGLTVIGNKVMRGKGDAVTFRHLCEESLNQSLIESNKLDGVGPVANRSSLTSPKENG